MLPWISIGLFVNLLILPGIWPIFHLDTELLLWEIRVGKKNVQNPKSTLVWGCWCSSHHTPSDWLETSQPGGTEPWARTTVGVKPSCVWATCGRQRQQAAQLFLGSHFDSLTKSDDHTLMETRRCGTALGDRERRGPAWEVQERGPHSAHQVYAPQPSLYLSFLLPTFIFFQRKAKRLNLLPLVKLSVDCGRPWVLPWWAGPWLASGPHMYQ